MQTAVRLVTFEEFQQLPEPPNGAYLELHGGEIVTMTVPRLEHIAIQARLQYSLRPRLEHLGFAGGSSRSEPCRNTRPARPTLPSSLGTALAQSTAKASSEGLQSW